MTVNFIRVAIATVAAAAAITIPAPLCAQAASGTTVDHEIPAGNNFAKAAFRLWLPDGVKTYRAVVLLMPGSNGDARSQVDDPVWRDFASRHQLALVGAQIVDKAHEQKFLEEYVNVSEGSGQAVLDALTHFASQSQHGELRTAPLLLWGMSAGGQFNYEFVAWKPERVLAFVVNKGGIYYTALTSRAARNVPGILFIGGKEPVPSRNTTIKGLFALNRRAGALWALAEEPGAAHVVGRSRDVALILFEDALRLRLSDDNPGTQGQPRSLKPISESGGFLGEIQTGVFQSAATPSPSPEPMAWLLTARVARAWSAMVTERPIEP
jgi:poly(3-hydroxybutyrate) depolymerase